MYMLVFHIKVNEINKKAIEIEQNEEGGVQNELDDILSDIYLLGTDDSIQTEDVIVKINNLAIQGSGNDTFESEAIKDLVELKERLLLYDDFLQLKSDLKDFLDENLKAVEEIDIEDETAKSEWIDKRNTDFNTFCTLINDLQETAEYAAYREVESGGEAAEPDGEASESISVSEKVWDANAVSEKAMKMQRDLLGELTDFERAFNYFSYGYPMMAFFSAFVAVFFDLGSFLTGCFLYMAEFFEVRVDKEEIGGKEESGDT